MEIVLVSFLFLQIFSVIVCICYNVLGMLRYGLWLDLISQEFLIFLSCVYPDLGKDATQYLVKVLGFSATIMPNIPWSLS